MTTRFDRPGDDEYAPFYATYVSKVPEGDLIALLTNQISEVMTLLRPVSEQRANGAYAPGKWTLKEVVGHIADTERVMSYRAMVFARADQGPLPKFDENAWIVPAHFNERTLGSLIDEWVAARSSSIALLAGLPADAPARRGIASSKEISVRALAHIIYGHVAHHAGIIRERYL